MNNQANPAPTSTPPAGNYDQYGGWLPLPIANPSGYFRTTTVAGRSWLVTPGGHAYFSLGVNLVAFGGKPAVNDSYDQRMFERYRNRPALWASDVAAQLSGWSFNTIGAFSDSAIRHHNLAETRVLALTPTSLNSPYNVRAANPGFADVFDPAFASAVSQIVATAISDPDITDRWLLGWFLDNELYWPKGGYYIDNLDATLSEDFIALPRAAAGKQAWVNQLIAKYNTIDNLNRSWGTTYTSFTGPEPTSLLNVTLIPASAAIPDKLQFLGAIADQYYRITCNAVRARDPNHLILGDRYIGVAIYREVVTAASKHIDVVSLNLYETNTADNLTLDNLDFAASLGKPMLVSEYGFRATTSGLPNNPPVQALLVPTDADRASAYQLMISEMARRPYVVGAHWFMHADRAILDTHRSGGYFGHHNWGLVDINNNPYPALISRATVENGNIYNKKLGQVADLDAPIPLSPMYAAPVFTINPTFNWRPVSGAISYDWQAARTPNFANPITAANLLTPTYTPPGTSPLSAGRWYWRVRANGGTIPAPYTTPQPFFVLRQTSTLLINGFETPPDVTIQGQGPDYRWVEEVLGDTKMVGTAIGVTQGQQAGLLTFSGQTNGRDNHYSWAQLYRYPNGGQFTPRNWSGYDYLSLDITNPTADIPAPLVGIGFSDDGGRGGSEQLPIRSGTTQATLSVDAAVAGGMNPAQMAQFFFATRRPIFGAELALDNLTLRQTARDTVPQPAITPTVTDAQADGALFVDWRNYQPATSTVAYRIYVSDRPGTPISSLTPVLTLDAVAQSTLLRCSLNLSQPGNDPNGYNILPNGQPFYITIVAVDYWGNTGAVASSMGATPSQCGISFSDMPPSNFAYAAVNELACLGIASGVGGGLFLPNALTTREQFAKLITLTRNWPIINPPHPTFSDVPTGNPLYIFVETAYANGAISGASQSACQARGLGFPCFLPHDPITRVQIAIILVRAYGWAIDTSGGPHFTDVPHGAFGYNEIETCYNRVVIRGVGGGLFEPNANATRAQVAVMLYISLRQFQDLAGNSLSGATA